MSSFTTSRRQLLRWVGATGTIGLAGGDDGSELVATLGADVSTHDPTQANDTTSRKAFGLVYEPLVTVDFGGPSVRSSSSASISATTAPGASRSATATTRAPRRCERAHAHAPRSIDAAKASHALLPRSLRRRALVVDCTTDRGRYRPDEPVHLRVTVRNRLPLPLRLRTRAPVSWTWSVDGVDRASEVATLPDDCGSLRFARREIKTFAATWYQRVRVASDEWVAVGSGEHTLGARLLVDDPTGHLAAEATVRIE